MCPVTYSLTSNPDNNAKIAGDDINHLSTDQNPPTKNLQQAAIDPVSDNEEKSEPQPAPITITVQTETLVEPFTRERIVKPSYPRQALRRGIEGEVIVQFDIDSSGHVVDPQVINAIPSNIFNNNVLKAIRKFLFSPQRVNGEAVGVQGVQETFTFVIES